MKTANFFSPLCVSLAMFALPAAAQTPDGMTPAEETVCDVLADATPGLQGLCVAFCEAQDCEATLDPETGIVEFDPSCKASSRNLLANYNDRAGPSDPPMPCLKIPCPCWSEAQIEEIGGFQSGDVSFDSCSSGPSHAGLFGFASDGSGWELAYAIEDGSGPHCYRVETNPPTDNERSVSAIEFQVCRQSVLDECSARAP